MRRRSRRADAHLFDVPATVLEERNVLDELEELLTRAAYLLDLQEEPAGWAQAHYGTATSRPQLK